MIRNERTRRITKVGGNLEESPNSEVEMVWACAEKIGGLRRKESDGHRNVREEERKAKEKMVRH